MAAFFGLMILAGIVAMIWPIWVLLNFDDITAEGTSWLVIFRDPVYLATMTTWLLFGNPYALAIVALAGAAFVLIRWSSRQRLFPAAMWVALTPSCWSLSLLSSPQ
jgi:hypothetical protein